MTSLVFETSGRLPPAGGKSASCRLTMCELSATLTGFLPRAPFTSDVYPMLGELDSKIMKALLKDGRVTWSELARRFLVSRVTIQNRVDAMQARKIITGYTVVTTLDRGRVDIPEQKAFFQVKFASGDSVFTLQKLLVTSPNVVGIWGVTGTWDCFVFLRADSMQQIATLREHINSNLKIKKILTYSVLNDFPVPLGAFQG